MAYTLNGIGTTFYGKRDFRGDGSYITTEWATFLFVPLIPFRNFRVKYQGRGELSYSIGVGSPEHYAIYEKTAPNWKQVLYIYGYVSFVVAWALLILTFGTGIKGNPALGMSVCLIGPFLPAPIPWLLRKYARQKLHA